MAARVYISGPMSGMVEFNIPLFNATAKAWRKAGWEVCNPAELDDDQNGQWADYMRRDIPELLRCTAIAMLPGWRMSRGAKLERYIAESLEMLVYEDALAPPDNPRDPKDRRTRAEKLAAMAATPGPEGEVARRFLKEGKGSRVGFLAGKPGRVQPDAIEINMTFGADFEAAINELTQRFRRAAEDPGMLAEMERILREADQ